LGAHSAGADHIRQRLFWVAHTGQFPTRSVSRSDSKDSTEWLAQTIQFTGCGEPSGMGDSNGSGLSEQCRAVSVSTEFAAAELRGDVGFWGRFDLIPCRDGKTRRIEPGSSPLVDGFPGRVGLLRGYGNAIVPQVAARFITAFMQSVGINA
jgi:DNA (cytosine-5)-methyltransferase 1